MGEAFFYGNQAIGATTATQGNSTSNRATEQQGTQFNKPRNPCCLTKQSF
jgi:hypothetical protein